MDVTDEDPEEWISQQRSQQFETFRDEEVVGEHCEGCQFSPDPLIKRGSIDADLMLVGEFPTTADRSAGNPFSGDLGRLAGRMLEPIGLDPEEDCYLTNALLCGGADADVEQASLDACRVNVERQVQLVSPAVVLALGRHAYCSLYHRRLGDDFAEPWGHQGSLPEFPWVEGVVTLNPVHLLRAESGTERHEKMKRMIWSHLQTVRDLLPEENASGAGDSEPEEEPSD